MDSTTTARGNTWVPQADGAEWEVTTAGGRRFKVVLTDGTYTAWDAFGHRLPAAADRDRIDGRLEGWGLRGAVPADPTRDPV